MSGPKGGQHTAGLEFARTVVYALTNDCNRVWPTVKAWTKKERDAALLAQAREVIKAANGCTDGPCHEGLKIGPQTVLDTCESYADLSAERDALRSQLAALEAALRAFMSAATDGMWSSDRRESALNQARAAIDRAPASGH